MQYPICRAPHFLFANCAWICSRCWPPPRLSDDSWRDRPIPSAHQAIAAFLASAALDRKRVGVVGVDPLARLRCEFGDPLIIWILGPVGEFAGDESLAVFWDDINTSGGRAIPS